jgi:hypothetical protein
VLDESLVDVDIERPKDAVPAEDVGHYRTEAIELVCDITFHPLGEAEVTDNELLPRRLLGGLNSY